MGERLAVIAWNDEPDLTRIERIHRALTVDHDLSTLAQKTYVTLAAMIQGTTEGSDCPHGYLVAYLWDYPEEAVERAITELLNADLIVHDRGEGPDRHYALSPRHPELIWKRSG
jgi:hypothetical protein